MSTPETVMARTPAALRADRITYGAVHLDVTDLERARAFWREAVGLAELSSDAEGVRLGVAGRALVVLHGGGARAAANGYAGLYHLAIHVPDEVEFARVLTRLAHHRVPQSPTDHIFSKATYVRDPDGIMLELTLETPERFSSMEITRQAVVIYDSDGRVRGASEPLDFAEAVAPLAGGTPEAPLPANAYVGHVHLHVPDLRAAYDFYRDVVGFSEHAYMTAIGMADLSAGGRFPHRIAINDWQGRGARQRPAGVAGMRHFELLVGGGEELDALAERAQAAGAGAARAGDGALSLADPAGNTIVVRSASA